MSIVTIIVVLLFVGIALWAINNYFPMDEKVKKIVNIVVILVLIVWLLNVFGVFGYLDKVKV